MMTGLKNMKMFKNTITIKVSLQSLILLCAIITISIILFSTNIIKNLTFMSLSTATVDTIVVHEQFGEKSAVLSQSDAETTIIFLQQIRLTGRSVRLQIAESVNPCYTLRLHSGASIQVAYYSGYYIINGRGYKVTGDHHINGDAISRLYLEQISNREYFPREADEE